jgi:hypothetical protein
MKKFVSYLILISLLLTGCKKKTPTVDTNDAMGSEASKVDVTETRTPVGDEGVGAESDSENCIFDFPLIEIEDISILESVRCPSYFPMFLSPASFV